MFLLLINIAFGFRTFGARKGWLWPEHPLVGRSRATAPPTTLVCSDACRIDYENLQCLQRLGSQCGPRHCAVFQAARDVRKRYEKQ